NLLTPEQTVTSHIPTSAASSAQTAVGTPHRAASRPKAVALGIVAVVGIALAYLVVDRLVLSKRSLEATHPTPALQPAAASGAVAFSPPPHSIAVLPFVNMGGDKDQEYFSDGLTEELLNSLVRIQGLQVAARVSSFSFKGKDADIATIARKLNVGAILEGSVRRGGHTIRVSAELTNAVTGFHLWSQTYDRQLSDVLQLQTDIANAVTSALRITLLGDIAQKVEMGGTHNPIAFDA